MSEPLLPEPALALVRGQLPALVDAVVSAAGRARPEYAEVLGGPDGLAIRLGIERALDEFMGHVERPDRSSTAARDVWQRLGQAEFQVGRELDALRAAFRAGAREAVRGATTLAAQSGASAAGVATLAEEIFIFVDELTSAVVDGYVRAQSDEAGERERRRRRLAALLLDGAAHDPETLERAADQARWPLPRTLAAVAVATDSPGRLASRLEADALTGADPDGAWLLLPDPEGPGSAAALSQALGDAPAAVGPTVGLGDAHLSLRWARLALVLRGAADPPGGPVRAVDHLGSIVLLQDPGLARLLISRALAGLAELGDDDRAGLIATLAAWLAHQRHVPTVAAELHVHPQTVRYRIGRLRELVGDRLDSPEGRFELDLALRAERMLGGVPSRAAGPPAPTRRSR